MEPHWNLGLPFRSQSGNPAGGTEGQRDRTRRSSSNPKVVSNKRCPAAEVATSVSRSPELLLDLVDPLDMRLEKPPAQRTHELELPLPV